MSEQSPELRQAVERVEEIAKSKKWISAMRGEGNGPGGQYDCVLMDERFSAALAAALRLAVAEARPCRNIHPPCDPDGRFGVCSACSELIAARDEFRRAP